MVGTTQTAAGAYPAREMAVFIVWPGQTAPWTTPTCRSLALPEKNESLKPLPTESVAFVNWLPWQSGEACKTPS